MLFCEKDYETVLKVFRKRKLKNGKLISPYLLMRSLMLMRKLQLSKIVRPVIFVPFACLERLFAVQKSRIQIRTLRSIYISTTVERNSTEIGIEPLKSMATFVMIVLGLLILQIPLFHESPCF